MTRRRAAASVVASPVLVGAVTILITIVAVFLAYNANAGLPFVPTYDVEAQLPSGSKLVAGNDVRSGGFRVGLVEEIEPGSEVINGRQRSIAVIKMKLDKAVEPLPADTTVRVRPRSALGLKYVELTPGNSQKGLAPGATISVAQSSEPLDLEDVLATFNAPTRDNTRAATQGFGDAFAGRGESLNATIAALNPLFKSLRPVMQSLAAPDTQLDQFFLQLGRTAAQTAPVAAVQARLFTEMADTFAAISANPAALQATIEKSPPTIDAAVSSFRVQQPFLADFADLSRRLRPAAQELPRSLPKINTALATGTPVLPDTVPLNRDLEGALKELDDLFRNPNTLLTLKDLNTALTVTRPAIEFIAPYQTVCAYSVYFLSMLGEVQSQTIGGPSGGGTVLNQGLKFMNFQQQNSYTTIESSRPVDLRPDQNPKTSRDALGLPLHRLYGQPYQPAIDAQGNADCQAGQAGYIKGPFVTDPRPDFKGVLANGTPKGANWGVGDSDFPILVGGTFVTRRLGITNLKDVP